MGDREQNAESARSDEDRDASVMRHRWQHRSGDRYIVIVASAVGNPNDGYRIVHDSTLADFPTIAQAKRYGLALDRSDDFNIGAIRGGKLVALLWMDEIVDDDPDEVADVAAAIGLPRSERGTAPDYLRGPSSGTGVNSSRLASPIEPQRALFAHTVRSCCRPVDTTRSHGVCPDCQHLRSGHNADGECGTCLSAQPYGGWKEKA